MKKISGILLISSLLIFPFFSFSNPQTHNIMKKFLTCNFFTEKNLFDGRFVLNFKEDIQLSDNQEKMIENKMISFEEYSISSCAAIKIQELHLASYLKSEKIDRNEVGKLIREINKAKTIFSIQYLNYILDIKSILNIYQIEKLKEIKKTYGRD